MTSYNLIQITAILLTGLLAGLFYGYDCSIINGLGNLDDKEYLGAFQSINRAILNPYFFLSFMGSLLALPVATWLSYKGMSTSSFYFLLGATAVYIICVFGITMFGNVPLNNLLDKFDLAGASADEIKNMRRRFEPGWNTLHHIRTYAAMLSFLLAMLSLLKRA